MPAPIPLGRPRWATKAWAALWGHSQHSGSRDSDLAGYFAVRGAVASAGLRLVVYLYATVVLLQWLKLGSDPNRCKAIVGQGGWPPYYRPPEDPTTELETLGFLERASKGWPLARPFTKWEPDGCRMHEYSREEMSQCLGFQRLLFVGDSTMRSLFFAAANRLDHEKADQLTKKMFVEDNPRHNLSITLETVQLDFIWDPWLKSDVLMDELNRHAGHPPTTPRSLPPQPAIIVLGNPGLWASRNAGVGYFDRFRSSINRVTPYLTSRVTPPSRQLANTHPDAQPPPNIHQVFLTPVIIPNYSGLLPTRFSLMSPRRIKRMGNYMHRLPLDVQTHILNAYNSMTFHVTQAWEDTGLHAIGEVMERWIDIPLNTRCNNWLARPRTPDDRGPSLAYKRTCCVSYPEPAPGQSLLLWTACCCMAFQALVAVFWNRRWPWMPRMLFSFLNIVVLYCYLGDRSHVFSKVEKHFSQSTLALAFVATGVACLASLQQVKPASEKDGGKVQSRPARSLSYVFNEADLLPRYITDELKGLMQAAILLLAYQDTAGLPAVDRWQRFFAHAYLFLSAYGHASYFLRTGDFSFRRVASVLLRINLLTYIVSLALDGVESGTENSTTLLHYFPRLVSFWFLVVFSTLSLNKKANKNLNTDALLGCIAASAFVAYLLFLWPNPYGLLEMAHRVGQACFQAEWNVYEMRQLIRTDMSAPFFGMLAAAIAQRATLLHDRMSQMSLHFRGRHEPSQHRQLADRISNDSGHFGPLDRLLVPVIYPHTRAWERKMGLVCVGVAASVGLGTAMHWEGVSYDKYHAYLAPVFVLAVAGLRSHPLLRAFYLAWPAALGRFALETYVLHKHILLSGNGTGLLRTGVWHRLRTDRGKGGLGQSLHNAMTSSGWAMETVMIVIVFLWVSWQAKLATRAIVTDLFGEGRGRGGQGSSLDDEPHNEQLIPLHNLGGGSSRGVEATAITPLWKRILADTRVKAGCVLLLVWVVNRFYVLPKGQETQ